MRRLLLIFLAFCGCTPVAYASLVPAALAERTELLPASLAMGDFTETPPERAVIGDAHLFATPFYGPQVYLLILRLDFEEIAPQVRASRVSSRLALRPAEQRLWAVLVRLPDDQWPGDGKPEVLAPLLESLETACADTEQILGSSALTGLYDARDGTLSISASLAHWRHGKEPVLIISMGTSSNSSGGGGRMTEAWYLSSARYALKPLACTPTDAGYWSKPSYDMEGNPEGDGANVSVVWRLQPGKPAADDSTQSLELRELLDTDRPGHVIAHYQWSYDRYQRQPPGP